MSMYIEVTKTQQNKYEVTPNVTPPSGGVSTLYLGVDMSDDDCYVTKDPSTLNVGDTFGLFDAYGHYGDAQCYQCTVVSITPVGSNYGITYTPEISDHNYIEGSTESFIELI